MPTNWLQVGSLLMFLGVALGAFGSHALKNKMDVHMMEVYKTAVLYHFIHAIAILVVAWLSSQQHTPVVQMAGRAFFLGIILFSGSLYLLSVTGIKWFGMITPFGGICFLAGWTYLFLASTKMY